MVQLVELKAQLGRGSWPVVAICIAEPGPIFGLRVSLPFRPIPLGRGGNGTEVPLAVEFLDMPLLLQTSERFRHPRAAHSEVTADFAEPAGRVPEQRDDGFIDR